MASAIRRSPRQNPSRPRRYIFDPMDPQARAVDTIDLTHDSDDADGRTVTAELLNLRQVAVPEENNVAIAIQELFGLAETEMADLDDLKSDSEDSESDDEDFDEMDPSTLYCKMDDHDISNLPDMRKAVKNLRARDPECQSSRCETCSICLESFSETNKARTLPCGDLYHDGCIEKLVVVSLKCPLCRDDTIFKRKDREVVECELEEYQALRLDFRSVYERKKEYERKQRDIRQAELDLIKRRRDVFATIRKLRADSKKLRRRRIVWEERLQETDQRTSDLKAVLAEAMEARRRWIN